MNTYAKYCPNVFLAKCEERHTKGDVVVLTTKYGKENEVEIWNFIFEKDGYYYYSFTRIDGYNRQERAKARAEKYENWANMAHERADKAFDNSQSAVEAIPFGQPIMVGHYSERRHRAAIKRSQSAMNKCVEESNKAEAHEHKAEYWERQAEKIDLSMPESVEYYKNEMEKAKEYHEGLKSGKYPRAHMYSLTYAKKAANEAEKNYKMAVKLWE